MTSFGHSKPCQKTMYIYASLSLIISLIKLMRVNYAYNNKKNLTWIFMKGTGCYSKRFSGIPNPSSFSSTSSSNKKLYFHHSFSFLLVHCWRVVEMLAGG